MSVDCSKFVVKYNLFYTMIYTIEKVTTLIGARRFGSTDAKIGFILTDSRSLCFPEETLFLHLNQAETMAIAIYLSSIIEAFGTSL